MKSAYIARFDVSRHLDGVPEVWDAVGYDQPGVKAVFYEGPDYQGHPTRCFAWIGLPKGASAKRPVPGIVLIHGGGGTALSHWVSHWNSLGYAAISMDTCGGVPCWNPSAVYRTKWPRHEYSGPAGWGCLDDESLSQPVKDQWPYHAAASVLRATALLKSLPEVDGANVGVGGISWGGYLTLVVTAIAPAGTYRFGLPVYGSAGFLELPSNIGFNHTQEQMKTWSGLWDPKPALKHIAMPMLFLTDAEDLPFPLPTWQRTTDAVSGSVQRSMRINYPHDHTISLASRTQAEFANAVVSGRPLPVWGKMRRNGAVIRCPFDACGRHLRMVQLCATRAEGLWADRKWNMYPARMENGCLEGTLVYGVTAAFFHVQDEQGCQWSSPVMTGMTTPGDAWTCHG